MGERIAKELAGDKELFIELLSYLKYDQTYVSACSLIEDILQYQSHIILSTIRKFLPSLQLRLIIADIFVVK